MLSNYLKIALRTFLRNKIYSFVNIGGLALGLATCLLTVLYVTDELSYDGFHTNKDRIYRVIGGQTLNNAPIYNAALMPAPLATEFKASYPEVEDVTRFCTAVGELRYNNTVIPGNEANSGIMTDNGSFFRIFSFTTLLGNVETTFNGKANIILTRSMAMRLFGNINDAVGKTVMFSGQPLSVSAVIEDVPRASHFRFEFIAPTDFTPEMSRWENNFLFTYILLKKDADWRVFNESVKTAGQKFITPALKKINPNWGWKQELQPLSDIRLYSNLTSEKGTAQRVQIFGLVGILVLILACINYANLSTARTMLRSREVGVRKTFGATRSQVMIQFMGETLGLVLIAFLLATVLVEIALPLFNTLSGKHFLHTDVFQARFLAAAAGVFFITVTVSGGYSALVLSSFRPSEALKTGLVSDNHRGKLRRILVVGQFTISTALVIVVLVMNTQLRYMNTVSLGFNKHQLVAAHFNNLFDKQETILNELKRLPGVEDVASTMQCPVLWTGGAKVNANSVADKETHTISSDLHFTGFDFARVMQIPVLEGRFFARGLDSANTVVVNASFAKAMGWKNPIGQTVNYTLNDKEMSSEVIGVVGDIHSKSLHSAISPVMYRVNRLAPIMLLRLKTENISQTISSIEKLYSSFRPEFPLELKFLDTEFAKLYTDDVNLAQTLLSVTIVAIVIASLGLFGLATFSAERRTKEIGIRKVLGASVSSIITLLSKDFLKLVGIAIIIATPLAYWTVGKWLQDFAYRTELSWWIFAAAGVSAVGIAFMTVAGQAFRAAQANPVQSLRSE